MPRIRQIAALTGAAALALTAVGSPAYAGTTEIRKVSDNSLYNGPAAATLIQNMVVEAKVLGVTTTTTCTTASMSGTVASNGPLSISAASVGGCSGSASGITFLGLPWSGGVTYAPQGPPGRNGYLTLNGFSVSATVAGVSCTYGGVAVANGFNGNNAARPVAANSQAQVNMAGITINKTAGSFLCPGSAAIKQGVFALTGGGQSLKVAGTYP